MSAANDTQKCAACGKGGDGLKRCNGCKLVKYCNATCQKEHRPKHKNECKKRAAELKEEALFKQAVPIEDEALFKEPPPRTECPICLLPLPIEGAEQVYQACCGKILCRGCCYAVEKSGSHLICPFCRALVLVSDREKIERFKADDAEAMSVLGYRYSVGANELPRDCNKAMELWLRAIELGCVSSYSYIADAYADGKGVERDTNKAKYYWERAAIGGK